LLPHLELAVVAALVLRDSLARLAVVLVALDDLQQSLERLCFVQVAVVELVALSQKHRAAAAEAEQELLQTTKQQRMAAQTLAVVAVAGLPAAPPLISAATEGRV
jgi:hypothetical protein